MAPGPTPTKTLAGPAASRPRRRRLRRVALGLSVSLLLALAVLWLYARAAFNGPNLARRVTDAINAGVVGRWQIESIDWSGRLPLDLLDGAATPITVEGVRLYDGNGNQVGSVDRVTVAVHVRPLLWSMALGHPLEIDVARLVVDTAQVQLLVRDGQPSLADVLEARPAGTGPPPEPASLVLHLHGIELRDLGFGLAGDGITANVAGIDDGDGSIDLEIVRGETRAFATSLDPTVRHAQVRVGSTELSIDDLAARRFDLDGPIDARMAGDVLRLDVGARVAGAEIRVAGTVADPLSAQPRPDLVLTVRHAMPLASQLLGQRFGGDGEIDVRATGTPAAPDLDGRIADVSWSAPTGRRGASVPLHLDHLHATFDGHALAADDLAVSGLGGSLRGSARLDLDHRTLAVDVQLHSVDDEPFLDPADRDAWGGTVSGRVHGTMSLDAADITGQDLDLVVVRHGGGPLPRQLRVTGTAHLTGLDELHVEPIVLRAAGATARLQGDLGLRSMLVHVALHLDVPDLGPLGALVGLALHGKAVLDAEAAGRVTAPVVRGRLQVADAGVPGLLSGASLSAALGLRDGRVTLDQLDAHALGGELQGSAWLDVLPRPGTPPELSASLRTADGRGLQLGALAPLAGSIDGAVALALEASGPIDRPVGQLDLSAPEVSLLGDRYKDLSVGLTSDATGVRLDHISLYREHGTAQILGGGTLGWNGQVDASINAESFPLQSLPGIQDAGIPIGGEITGGFQLGGSLWPRFSPQVAAQVDVVRPRIGTTSLGAVHIQLEPRPGEPPGTIFDDIVSSFVGRDSHIAELGGYVEALPEANGIFEVRLHDTPIEQFFPEISKLADVHGTISGVIDLEYDHAEGKLALEGRITGLDATISEIAENGARKTFAFSNDDDLVFRVRDLASGEIEIVGKPTIAWANGDTFTIQGYWGASGKLRVDGKLSLAVLEPFVQRWISRVGGEATANLLLERSDGGPVLAQGRLELAHAALVPMGSDSTRPILVPHGTLDLSPVAIRLSDLVLELDDKTVHLAGNLALAGLRPGALNLVARGEIAGRWLEMLAANEFSDTAGAVRILGDTTKEEEGLHIGGTIAHPSLHGAFVTEGLQLTDRTFPQPIEFTAPRGDASAGQLRVDSDDVTDSLAVTVDQLGANVGDAGSVELEGSATFDVAHSEIADVNLALGLEELLVGSSDSVSASLDGQVRLSGSSQRGLALTGKLTVADGRVSQNLDYVRMLLPTKTREESTLFYEDMPLLANMALDVKLDTAGNFRVDDNIAHAGLDGRLAILGTLADPRLDGTLNVVQGGAPGTIKIPIVRPTFTLDPGGQIQFDGDKPIMEATLNLPASTLFTDTLGVDHNIHLRIVGTLAHVSFEWSSDDGLEPGQIIVLIVSGRTEQQALQALSGTTPTAGGVASTSSQDIIAKDISSAIISQELSPALDRFVHFDVLRPEIGTDSLAFYGEKRFLDKRLAMGVGIDDNYLYGVTYNGLVNLRLNDRFSLGLSGQSFKRGENGVPEDYTRLSGGLKLHWVLGQ